MQIFVRGPANLLAFNIEKDDTLQDVYECIAQESGCVLNDIVLSLHGAPLNNEQLFEEFNLVPGSTIDAHVKVLGGKTHGRLNNAGKVKNATPKVAPTEKPKKKTGRARRREQYAHRFANKVVSPSGDRRGPNSNY
ncbi:unnamed protein product [Rotaria socialis]|uniref:Ubiquitin-like domain-containing protein n=1 Tax=Rotaria socialis TaxID=392032 RepID=A0A820TL31_9BILA|nr:unnamed protein product [Rotaria socialis]CAF3329335.1 unnamed protein product [Rotaria socialis]CAF3349137.1 unnamed protein product [Rotaria socialis]CAF3639116.1 unnamed protein product [Rotaria socialis]CAF4201272.1 unnamed protein product [Rotaria socialis]